jgi:hypothetical protein
VKVKLSASERVMLFRECEESGYSLKELSSYLGFHRRTISDWCRGKYLIPLDAYESMIVLSKLNPIVFCPVLISEKEQRQKAGLIGGTKYWEKYGRIGTLEDRIKGGMASYQKRKHNIADIFTRNMILKPQMSSKLAEFTGISMGDGCITDYQVCISLNSTDDRDYIIYIAQLCEELFGLEPAITQKGKTNCTNIVLSSRELVEFLANLGLPLGDKIRNHLDLPDWIKENEHYSRACVRGLFDTDGSIFLETHRIKDKMYSYPRWSFVSASEHLRESAFAILVNHGLEPKLRMDRSVNLERFTDIEKYFKMIGSSNLKHVNRFRKFGEVA